MSKTFTEWYQDLGVAQTPTALAIAETAVGRIAQLGDGMMSLEAVEFLGDLQEHYAMAWRGLARNDEQHTQWGVEARQRAARAWYQLDAQQLDRLTRAIELSLTVERGERGLDGVKLGYCAICSMRSEIRETAQQA